MKLGQWLRIRTVPRWEKSEMSKPVRLVGHHPCDRPLRSFAFILPWRGRAVSTPALLIPPSRCWSPSGGALANKDQ